MSDGRYQVRATLRDGSEQCLGETDDAGEALQMILGALHGRANYAGVWDLRPDTPRPVSEEERALLNAITPKMPRTMGQ